jgi:glycerol-3-phosphate dehydrogenase
VTRPLTRDGTALLISIPEDRRVFFIIPRRFEGREASLVGTTDTDFQGDPAQVRAEKDEIEYLLRQVRQVLPQAKLRPSDIWATYAGVRPLAAPPKAGLSEGATPRESMLDLDQGILSMSGGKFTTYRSFCQEAVERAAQALRAKLKPSLTHDLPLPGAPVGSKWEDYSRTEAGELSVRFKVPLPSAEWLVSMHGVQAREVLELAEREPSLTKPLERGLPVLKAQALWAAQNEDAVHLSDFFLRRSFLGLVPTTAAALSAAAKVMGKELGWSQIRRESEVKGLRKLLQEQYR